jgi:hypothetical protein
MNLNPFSWFKKEPPPPPIEAPVLWKQIEKGWAYLLMYTEIEIYTGRHIRTTGLVVSSPEVGMEIQNKLNATGKVYQVNLFKAEIVEDASKVSV